MFLKIQQMLLKHFKTNASSYFFLFLAFIIGVSAGAFTVNGLSAIQRDELANYFQGFLQLLDNQRVDSGELMRIALYENSKIVLVLWILGVTIIGIPFIYIFIGIRGFITGFSSGFIIEVLGMKGVTFTLFALLPKEIVIIPCLIALGVNGINFSLNIIRRKSIKLGSKENPKMSFLTYCAVTLVFASIIIAGAFVEAYISPVLIRIITPFVLQ